jgi:glutamine cyclotransferase
MYLVFYLISVSISEERGVMKRGSDVKIMARVAAIAFACLSSCRIGVSEAAVLRSAECYGTISSKVVRRVPAPAGYHEGLMLDGKVMWLANGQCGKVMRIDLDTGVPIKAIDPISTFTEGVSRYGDKGYFVTDWDDKKLYRAKLEGDKLVPEASVSFDPAHPAGVAWTGSRLFVITWTRGMGTKFDLVELDADLRVLCRYRMRRIQEPSQLAWDGKNLWISSWYSKLVYKVDIDAMEILGSFHSPVSLTTGIVWDGSSMWVIGTDSDLYQLTIGSGE